LTPVFFAPGCFARVEVVTISVGEIISE
jgi:hypothetical protein